MIRYPNTDSIQGAILVGKWGNTEIPIVNVPNMHSLNQLVGYVKHINAGEGTVLYRGQCQLYPSVSPSIKHEPAIIEENQFRLNKAIESISQDDDCLKFFGLNVHDVKGWELYRNLVIEAVLQHYGAKTYSVDFVDNHWTALWFGLYKWDEQNSRYIMREPSTNIESWKHITKSTFFSYNDLPPKPTLDDVEISDRAQKNIYKNSIAGTISYEDIENKYKQRILKDNIKKWEIKCKKIKDKNTQIDQINNSEYLYIFLYVADTNVSDFHGLYIGTNTYTIDLRKMLPSTFLRPSSQHGWIVKGKDNNYDFNLQIPCVIQVDINLAKTILGNGLLLSQENFFPNSTIDQGYRVLLERQSGSKKYKKLMLENMITVINE